MVKICSNLGFFGYIFHEFFVVDVVENVFKVNFQNGILKLIGLGVCNERRETMLSQLGAFFITFAYFMGETFLKSFRKTFPNSVKHFQSQKLYGQKS